MTSKLKCPFCGTPLWHPIGKPTWSCQNWNCLASDNMIGNHTIWEKLIQAKQDLEIATKAFEMIRDEFGIENRLATPVMQGLNMKAIAEKALEQIEHKE